MPELLATSRISRGSTTRIEEEEIAGPRRPYANTALAVLTPHYGEAQRVRRDVRVELANVAGGGLIDSKLNTCRSALPRRQTPSTVWILACLEDTWRVVPAGICKTLAVRQGNAQVRVRHR